MRITKCLAIVLVLILAILVVQELKSFVSELLNSATTVEPKVTFAKR